MSTQDDLEDVLNLVPRLYRLLSCPVEDTGELQQMSMTQYRAMFFIKRNPESTLSEVARELDITLGSASDLVDRLVVMELIERRTNPVDRRQIQLSLTASALQMVSRIREERKRQLYAVKDSMTNIEWQAFSQGLDTWVKVLDACTPRKHDLITTHQGKSSES